MLAKLVLDIALLGESIDLVDKEKAQNTRRASHPCDVSAVDFRVGLHFEEIRTLKVNMLC